MPRRPRVLALLAAVTVAASLLAAAGTRAAPAQPAKGSLACVLAPASVLAPWFSVIDVNTFDRGHHFVSVTCEGAGRLDAPGVSVPQGAPTGVINRSLTFDGYCAASAAVLDSIWKSMNKGDRTTRLRIAGTKHAVAYQIPGGESGLRIATGKLALDIRGLDNHFVLDPAADSTSETPAHDMVPLAQAIARHNRCGVLAAPLRRG